MIRALSAHSGARPMRSARRKRRVYCALIVASMIAITPDGSVQAQLVERNLPPEPPRRASALKIDTNDLLRSDDATPLGVNLRAIVLLGADAAIKQRKG